MKVVSLAPLFVILGVIASLVIAVLSFCAFGVSFTKNISSSAPLGIYALIAPGDLNRGDFVTMKIPARISRFAEKTPWLNPQEPLLKTVAALSNDTVCLRERELLINGQRAARARPRDRQGKRLPHWRGCRTLRANEFLALNTYSSRSFDGRYFGPTRLSAIRHRAIPVLTYLEAKS